MANAMKAMRAYLAQRYEMPDADLDAMAADLAEIANQHQTQQLTLNGYQLLDALNSIAPQRNAKQLSTTLCISTEPACTPELRRPPKLHCWLADYPKAGSLALHDSGDHQQRVTQDFIEIATKLVECARWVNSTPQARKQPEARRLANVILHLTHPLISAHVDATQRTA
ncbi:hypothetical protein [Delftia sp. PS-11]|uniref:hypothetical protein n=1 Tax=Delftia sp. PS-11 TaxID=2767222 RepID=UPI003AB7D577